MMRASQKQLAGGMTFSAVVMKKHTTGGRYMSETITRSVPFMTKVPFDVMNGISPMSTSCSLISRTERESMFSLTSKVMRRNFTKTARRKSCFAAGIHQRHISAARSRSGRLRLRFARKIFYGDEPAKNSLQAVLQRPREDSARGKLIVGLLLHLDQIWHFSCIGNGSKALANTLPPINVCAI